MGRGIKLAIRLFALGLITSAVAGCGFAPVYGERPASAPTQMALDDVKVATIGNRLLGVEMRNNLIDRINPNGEPTSPLYRLEVDLSTQRGGVLVQPDASVTRYDYTLTAHYKLIGIEKNEALTSGTISARASYNVVESEYATLIAQQDAGKRAARSLSDDLSLRIALYFSGQAS